MSVISYVGFRTSTQPTNIKQFPKARLKAEYGADAIYEPVNFNVARWVRCDDPKKMAEFEKKNIANMARDAEGCFSFLTTSEWQLGYCMEEWPEIEFFKTREIN